MTKKILIPIILLGTLFLLKQVYIPVYKNDYQSIKHKTADGILPISKDWTYHSKNKFIDEWWQPEPHQGHFKKEVEHNWFSVKSEADYFLDSNRSGVYFCRSYDFKNNEFTYFRIDFKENNPRIDEFGRIGILESGFKKTQISKHEFDNEIFK